MLSLILGLTGCYCLVIELDDRFSNSDPFGMPIQRIRPNGVPKVTDPYLNLFVANHFWANVGTAGRNEGG